MDEKYFGGHGGGGGGLQHRTQHHHHDDDLDLDSPSSGFSAAVRTFDAFPKTRPTYSVRTARGGLVTLLITVSCLLLFWVEFGVYLDGVEEQHFLIEPAIGHVMQINIDLTVAMPCDDLHVNVQDAVGDRVMAGELLHREGTRWIPGDAVRGSNDESGGSMWKVLGNMRKKKRSFEAAEKEKERKKKETLKLWKQRVDLAKGMRGGKAYGKEHDHCRIWGSLDVNKVQGDFHVTAKGHGYWDSGAHVDHKTFNFSHIINELSFGDFYPKLINPLDGVIATTPQNFHKFQYFLSIVPTMYHSVIHNKYLATNQYAVTTYESDVSPQAVPGIFFKFDVEPVSLAITDRRMGLLQFLVRLVNIAGGVFVSGGWIYKVYDKLVRTVRGQGRPGMGGRARSDGMLHGRAGKEEEYED